MTKTSQLLSLIFFDIVKAVSQIVLVKTPARDFIKINLLNFELKINKKPFFQAMAHSGFCSNEQIIKSIKKRFKNLEFFLVSPEILFLEEFYMFLEESSAMDGLTATTIIKSGKQKYKELPMSDKMRYVKLAQEFNGLAFDD